jgi:hypothetical protein
MERIMRGLSIALVVCFFSSGLVWAQATAQISGTVRDQSGAVLPGVEVSATQSDTGVVRTTVTNETGSFVLPNLALGPYRLEASLPGFRTFAQTGIVLQVNSNPVVNAVLEVGQVAETIEVQANAAMVETRNVGIGHVIENERILELPLNGRNVADLIELSGAAVRTGTTSNRTFPGSPILSIAGSILSGTTYMLDGAQNIDPYNGQSLPLPFPDALQEFKVETSGLTAQNGRGNTVGAVTKAGTNEFHGSLFEFVRNDLFNARNYFSETGSTLKRNQFGGTIGGPIVKNKLFFFSGYQGTILRQDPADLTAFVPTAAMLAGDWTGIASPACNAGRQITLRAPFVNNRIDPALYSRSALTVANQLPKTSNPCGELRYGQRAVNDLTQIVGKVDYQLSDKHSLFGRYLATSFDQPFPYSFDSNLLTTPTAGYDNLAQSYALGSTYLISPNMVNAFRLTVTRAAVDRTGGRFFGPTDIGVKAYSYIEKYMNITVTGGFAVGGGQTSPATYRTTSYMLSDDVSVVRGTHQMSFGGSLAQTRSNAYSNSTAIARYAFNGQAVGMGLADFMTGRMSSLLQGAPGTNLAKQWYAGLYAQDTWKATPKLTLNGGLRWDPYLPWESTKGTVFHFDHDRFLRGIKSTVFKNAPAGLYYPGDPGFPGKQIARDRWVQLAPRVGLAWDVEGNGRTAVRASYGLSYEQIPLQWFSDTLTASPFFNRVNLPNPAGGFEDPWRDTPGGNPFPLRIDANAEFVPFGIYLNRDYDERTPYIQSWNLGVQRQIAGEWLLSTSYIGTQGVHVWEVKNLNQARFLGLGPCTLNGVSYPVCSTLGNINQRRPFTLERPQDGQYLGQVELMESGNTQSYHGLLIGLERRAARGLIVNGNYTWSHCIGGDAGSQDQGVQDGSGYVGTRDAERGNCASSRRHVFNLTAVAETPQFGNPTVRALATGWRLSGIYRYSTGSFLTVTSGVDRALSGVGGQRPDQILASPYGDKSAGPLSNFLNPAAFALPAVGSLGNMGRANVMGPATWQFDLALSRTFRIRETQRLEFRAEAYNVTNSFRPDNPDTNLNTANFGVIREALEPRIMQFALKYVF